MSPTMPVVFRVRRFPGRHLPSTQALGWTRWPQGDPRFLIAIERDRDDARSGCSIGKMHLDERRFGRLREYRNRRSPLDPTSPCRSRRIQLHVADLARGSSGWSTSVGRASAACWRCPTQRSRGLRRRWRIAIPRPLAERRFQRGPSKLVESGTVAIGASPFACNGHPPDHIRGEARAAREVIAGRGVDNAVARPMLTVQAQEPRRHRDPQRAVASKRKVPKEEAVRAAGGAAEG